MKKLLTTLLLLLLAPHTIQAAADNVLSDEQFGVCTNLSNVPSLVKCATRVAVQQLYEKWNFAAAQRLEELKDTKIRSSVIGILSYHLPFIYRQLAHDTTEERRESFAIRWSPEGDSFAVIDRKEKRIHLHDMTGNKIKDD